MRRKLKAFWLGFRDAYLDRGCLSMGLTWDDDEMNEAYDRGANWGEKFYNAIHFRRDWV